MTCSTYQSKMKNTSLLQDCREQEAFSSALWYRESENVSQHWESSFAFFVTEQAKRCTDVYTVSRSFTEAVHTQTGHVCSAAGEMDLPL